MKSLSNLLHRTPWAVLLLGGVLVILGLVAFLTPFHLIDYKDDGATAEERRAISREVDSAFADGALELARGAVLTMRSAAKDPSTRAELDQALTEIDRAREEMRDAGAKVLEAKREAVDSASEAVK
ncbi:MAG TPA: hypothetical protein PLD37_00150, partial [Usitatibacteraceae bacterium]|nr:hypothetical protein [Usitatibacteraceae bacterium]